MPEFFNKAINNHQYPKIYSTFPFLLRLHHFLTAAITLRLWYVKSIFHKTLKSNKKPFTFIDAGSGGGDIILPLAKKYVLGKFIGLDNLQGNIDLCNAVAVKKNIANCQFFNQNLEKTENITKTDYLACITVLQYIEDDLSLLGKFREALSPSGKLFIYVATENKRYFRWYRKMLKRITKDEMYDSTRGMLRVYTAKEIRKKIIQSGFNIEKEIVSYGKFGKMAYELYQTGIFALKRFSLLPAILFLLFFIPCVYPLILILMITDYLRKNSEGNGLLLVASPLKSS